MGREQGVRFNSDLKKEGGAVRGVQKGYVCVCVWCSRVGVGM